MRLVLPSQHWIRKYFEICEHRGLHFTPWVGRALFVADGDELVAGVMVYDSAGPFLFFEHLLTNETATLRQRWCAVDMMASEIPMMCRHAGKLPLIHVQHKGIERILQRHGLILTGARAMSCAMTTLETDDFEKPQFADQYSRCIPYSARTEPAPPGDPEDCA